MCKLLERSNGTSIYPSRRSIRRGRRYGVTFFAFSCKNKPRCRCWLPLTHHHPPPAPLLSSCWPRRCSSFTPSRQLWHIARTRPPRYRPFTNSITKQAKPRPLQIASPRSSSSIGFRFSSLSLSSAALLKEKLWDTGGKPPESKDLADSDPATPPSRSPRASTPLASPSSSPVPFSSFPPPFVYFHNQACSKSVVVRHF